MEARYKMLTKSNPEEAKRLLALAQQDVDRRWAIYSEMASETDGSGQKQAPSKSLPH